MLCQRGRPFRCRRSVSQGPARPPRDCAQAPLHEASGRGLGVGLKTSPRLLAQPSPMP